jgi:hypothetical protein
VISGLAALVTDIIVMVTEGNKNEERTLAENWVILIIGVTRQAANFIVYSSMVYILNRFSKD